MGSSTPIPGRTPPRIVAQGANDEDPSGNIGQDDEINARRAISYLTFHELVVNVTFPGERPAIRGDQRLLGPHLVGIERDMAVLATRYILCGLANDMGLNGIEIGDGAY